MPCPTVLLQMSWWAWLGRFSKDKVLFVLRVVVGVLFSPLVRLSIIVIYSPVGECVGSRFFLGQCLC